MRVSACRGIQFRDKSGAVAHLCTALALKRFELVRPDTGRFFENNDTSTTRAGELSSCGRSDRRRRIKRRFRHLGRARGHRLNDISPSVHGKVGQLIRQFVLVAEVVLQPGRLELPKQCLGLVIQDLQVRVPNAVFAAHLLDDQLTVPADDDPASPQLSRFLHGRDQSPILGDIIRRSPDESAEGDKRCAIR